MDLLTLSILILSGLIFQNLCFLVLSRRVNHTHYKLCEEKWLSKTKLEIERSRRQIEMSLYDDKIREAMACNREFAKENEKCKAEKLKLEMEIQKLKEGK